ncbi:MAG: IS4 family transposase [Firmicutes bacterium]|nr:IS4 family transposase [Bacillota bacterium]
MPKKRAPGGWTSRKLRDRACRTARGLWSSATLESDIYDVFVAAQHSSYDVLVRSAHNRQVQHPGARQLWEAAESADILGTDVIDVPRKEDHPLRQASLTLRATTVQLQVPHGREKEELGTPTVQIILAKETHPPEGQASIGWMLLTTLPVTTFEETRQLVRWYTYRWRIERFHFILKSGGSHVEKLQRETFERLTRAITLYSIIAWRLLWMTYPVRLSADQPCSVAFTSEEEQALRRLYEHQRPRKGPRSGPYDPTHRLTLREAMYQGGKNRRIYWTEK